jgi:HEAT repeat protein
VNWVARNNAAAFFAQNAYGKAFDPLVKLLGDENDIVRYHAVIALSRIGGPRIVDPIIPMLRDPSAEVRLQAVLVLGATEDRRAMQPLLGVLNDTRSDIRYYATIALGLVGDQEVGELFLKQLKEATDARHKEALIMALGELRYAWAVPVLIQSLSDPHVIVRIAAADWLGVFRAPEVSAALQSALFDSDQNVRATAAQSLFELKNSRGFDGGFLETLFGKKSVAQESIPEWLIQELDGPFTLNQVDTMITLVQYGVPLRNLPVVQPYLRSREYLSGLS